MKVALSYELTLRQPGQAMSVWLPMPANTEYQKVISMKHESDFAEVGLLSESVYGARALFARWQGGGATRSMWVRMEVETRERRTPSAPPPAKPAVASDEVKLFLQPTAHIPTDGIVKREAGRITAGRKDPAEKARAIYDWIIENTHRDFQVAWCGLGDVKSMLESGNLRGKCVDINSLFVALARASGIPAREVFGIRAGESRLSPTLGKSGTITTAQHCKGEVCLHETGWSPVDPADVVKVMEEKLPAETIHTVREYFFGNSEDNWVAFNHARDFSLNPRQNTGLLNYFMYPYCEVDGKPVELRPGSPGYTIVSEVLESA